jgi:transposase InsO family protein
VSASGYRQHLARRKKILTRRHLSETALLVEIRAVYAEARGAYGWPRVWRQLKASGVRVGKRRVELAMRQNGLRGRGKRRFRVSTTDSNHALPIAPNLLREGAATKYAWIEKNKLRWPVCVHAVAFPRPGPPPTGLRRWGGGCRAPS